MSYLAEKYVIGSLLMDKDCMSEIYGMLEADMFTSELLGRVFHDVASIFRSSSIVALENNLDILNRRDDFVRYRT